MITLKQLQWNDCFSYGSNNELLLNDNTVTQIVGTNGTGKSSIPLIIIISRPYYCKPPQKH